ncbi:MAG TPA: hypothetical protein VLY23_07755 [Candidatus Acidoferrum sp.]|nr:hypothetical protein [Candidatus Acidoferrum sp.]
MRNNTVLKVAALFIFAAGLLGAAAKEPAKTSVKGFVLDSACAFVKNITKPVSKECAISCAKSGSPLVVLGDDGVIYWPISDAMPAVGQNEKLLPFAAERVTVTGRVFVRGGSHAIVIDKIEPAVATK